MIRIIRLSFLIAIVVSLSACAGTADKKVPQLANELCGCFTKFQETISVDAKEMMKAVAESASPQSEMMKGMSKLKPEDANDFGEKLRSVGTPGSTVYACMQEFDKKHSKETTKDKQALTEQLLDEMLKNNNCPVGAAIINLSLKKNSQ